MTAIHNYIIGSEVTWKHQLIKASRQTKKKKKKLSNRVPKWNFEFQIAGITIHPFNQRHSYKFRYALKEALCRDQHEAIIFMCCGRSRVSSFRKNQ